MTPRSSSSASRRCHMCGRGARGFPAPWLIRPSLSEVRTTRSSRPQRPPRSSSPPPRSLAHCTWSCPSLAFLACGHRGSYVTSHRRPIMDLVARPQLPPFLPAATSPSLWRTLSCLGGGGARSSLRAQRTSCPWPLHLWSIISQQTLPIHHA